MHDTAAVDMFVVVTAGFRRLYALIVLGHERRKVIHFDFTPNPTQGWLARQITEAFPWDTAPRFLLRDRDASFGPTFRNRVQAMANNDDHASPALEPELQQIAAQTKKEGSVMQEREILLAIDL